MFGRLVVLLKKHRPRKTKDSARTQSGSRFADLLKRQVPAVIRSLPTQQRTTAPPTLGDAKVQGTCSNARVPRFSCRCRNNGRTHPIRYVRGCQASYPLANRREGRRREKGEREQGGEGAERRGSRGEGRLLICTVTWTQSRDG